MPHSACLIVFSSEYATVMDQTYLQIQPVFLNQTADELNFASGLRFIGPTFDEAPYSYRNSPVEVIPHNDEAACIDCLRQSRNHRVFFIVLSAVSNNFIQQMTTEYRYRLEKLSGLQRLSIYVLCGNDDAMRKQMGDDQHSVRTFSAKNSLLAEVASDTADHFVLRGQEQQKAVTCQSLYEAFNFFNWAKILFKRANDFERSSVRDDRLVTVQMEFTRATDLLRKCNNGTNEIDESIAAGTTSADMVVGNTQMDWASVWHPDLLPPSIVCVESIPEEMSCVSSSSPAKCNIPEKDKSVKMSKNNMDVGIFLMQSLIEPTSCKPIVSVLSQLFGENLVLVGEGQYYHPLMKRVQMPVIVLSSTVLEQEQTLEGVTFKESPAIYVLGKAPKDDAQRRTFFKAHPLVHAVTEDPLELAVQIAVEVAMRNRILGDHYARDKNNICARQSYDQCIDTLNHLQKLADNRLSNRD